MSVDVVYVCPGALRLPKQNYVGQCSTNVALLNQFADLMILKQDDFNN